MNKPIRPIRLISPIGLIGLISLTACAGGGDDGTMPPTTKAETAISFRSTLASEETVTRASELEENNVTSFTVWAYKNMSYDDATGYGGLQTVIDGYNVNWTANTANTTTSNTHKWEYVGVGDQTIKYWDWSAKAYRFFGTAPHASYQTDKTDAVCKVTLSADATDEDAIAATPYYSHLWFSTGNTTTYPGKAFGQAVQLTFLKPLTRVRFILSIEAKAKADGIERSSLSGIQFKPSEGTIASKGKVVINYPLTGSETTETWESGTVSGQLSEFVIDYYDEVDGHVIDKALPEIYPNSPEHWNYALPAKTQSSYKLIVFVKGVERTATVPAEFMSWEPGYEYTYRFKITESGGVELDGIQVGINDWLPKGTADHSIYNW